MRPEERRVRWRHLAGHSASERPALTVDRVAGTAVDVPVANGSMGYDAAAGGEAPLAAAREELATVIASFAETALEARQRAELEADRIRREADAYAESKRAEAERLLEAALRRAGTPTDQSRGRDERQRNER
jgi:hypothetical protein